VVATSKPLRTSDVGLCVGAEEHRGRMPSARSSIASAMSTIGQQCGVASRGLAIADTDSAEYLQLLGVHTLAAGVDSPTAAGHAGQGGSDIVVISSAIVDVCRPTRRPTPWPRPPWRRHAGYWP